MNIRKSVAAAAAVVALLGFNVQAAHATSDINVSVSANGTQYTGTYSASTTVAEVRDDLLSELGFSAYKHHLAVNGRQLSESATLAEVGATDAANLEIGRSFNPLTVKVYRAGGPEPVAANRTACTGGSVLKSAGNVFFEWGGGVVAGCREEGVWVTLSGYIAYEQGGTHELCIDTDDGNRVNIDGEDVIVHWTENGDTWDCANISFEPGVAKAITVEQYENGGGARVALYDDSSRDGNRHVLSGANFNSTPNFLFGDPNKISSESFDNRFKLTTDGKAAVANWLANAGSLSKVTIVSSAEYNENYRRLAIAKSVRSALRSAGYRGSVIIQTRNGYVGAAVPNELAVWLSGVAAG